MRVRGAVVLFVCVLVSLAGLTGTAGAHTGNQSYVYLDITESALGGRVEFPMGDVRTVFGLSLTGTDEQILAEVNANEADLEQYAADHLDVGSAGKQWQLDFTEPELLQGKEEWNRYVLLPFVADLGGAKPPRQLEVRFDPFIDEIENRDALLLIGNDWNGGVVENGEEVLVGFDANTRTRTIDLGGQSRWSNLAASVEIGVDHIRTGPDHILFVLVLLLPSVLIYGGRSGSDKRSWAPGRSFRGGLWRVLKVGTMFTLAHSITFTLAGLDLLPLPPSKVVETVIALSIAAAALHNLWPVAPNREWLIAFAFGLFHGLGFASLVTELDVARSTQLVSLLGRNLGIEIGQAVVIVMTFPALHLLRRTKLYRPLFIASSIGLAVIALGWMVERLAEVNLRVSELVDKFTKFPRSLVFAVLITACAAAAYLWERRANRLLAVHGEGDDTVVDLTEPQPEWVPSLKR